jgi:hypothetical protein
MRYSVRAMKRVFFQLSYSSDNKNTSLELRMTQTLVTWYQTDRHVKHAIRTKETVANYCGSILIRRHIWHWQKLFSKHKMTDLLR